MGVDFSELFEERRKEIGAPSLQAGTRAFQVLVLPTFHPPFAISLIEFGDYADVTLHGQSIELFQWEDGRFEWRRRPSGIWRESKTAVGEPLAAFRRSVAEIAFHRLSDRFEAERDGILLELIACADDRKLVARASSPGFDTAHARFTRALVQIATTVSRFDESRALLRGIEGYGIVAPDEPPPDVRRRSVKRTAR